MSLIAALAAGLALSVSPADLLDLKPEDRADLQCLTVTVVTIGGSEDPEIKTALASGATYYYGRLQGRTPGTDWLKRLEQYIRTEPLAELEANRLRCGQEMQTVGQAFIAMGADMQGS